MKLTFSSQRPFEIEMGDGQHFRADAIIRMIPKRRLVAFGTWLDKPVVAKLFFHPDHSKKHITKENNGLIVLRQNKIPTPACYYQGMSEDRRVHMLIFERLMHSKSLDAIWKETLEKEAIEPILKSVVLELATQHVLGVLQNDLHMKNFLIRAQTVYTLDAADIEQHDRLLPKKICMDNLALFFSQLGVGKRDLQIKLFEYYAKSRGWLLKKQDYKELFFSIQKYNRKRWKKFDAKIKRSSTDFCRIKTNRLLTIYLRHYDSKPFQIFLNDPDAIFNNVSTPILKNGRSSTVIKTKIDDHTLVVKRYNIKNKKHFLKRMFRATRAFKTWRLSQKLNFFEVTTAKPIAFIEKRWFFLRRQSYFVTEFIEGPHALDFFKSHHHNEALTNLLADRIIVVLKNLAKLEMTHGDLKLTNILIQNLHPVLIDLDGAKEHVTLASLRAAWKNEIKRLMKNFEKLPLVGNQFKMLFEKK